MTSPTRPRSAREVFAKLLRLPARGSRALGPITIHPPLDAVLTAWDARDAEGKPRFLEVALLWPKRSGKSLCVAGLALTELVGNVHEPDREIVLIASALAQSTDIVLQQCKRFVQRHPFLAKVCRPTKTEIIYAERVTDHATGGHHLEEHVIRSIPSNEAAHQHGRNHNLLVVDELHALMNDDILEALARPANRAAPSIVYSSYLGLKSQMRETVPIFDLWCRMQAATDPTLFCSYLHGATAYADIPWVTSGFLESQRRQFSAVPAKYTRLFLNQWAVGDAGSFLSTAEIQDATDHTHVEPLGPVPGARYAVGLDLGLTRDLTGLVLSHIDTGGRLIVDAVRSWRGSRSQLVDLRLVRTAVLHFARTFQAHVHLDQWQGALLQQELAQEGVRLVRTHTIESAKLDTYASLLKTLFLTRTIKVPPDVELLSQLETLEGAELARRDRVRFTSSGQAHDDLPVAICLSCESHIAWATTGGVLRLRATRLGLSTLADVDRCIAADVAGEHPLMIGCPIADGGPSALPGCRRFEAFRSVEVLYHQHLATEDYLPFQTFAATRVQPCDFVTRLKRQKLVNDRGF